MSPTLGGARFWLSADLLWTELMWSVRSGGVSLCWEGICWSPACPAGNSSKLTSLKRAPPSPHELSTLLINRVHSFTKASLHFLCTTLQQSFHFPLSRNEKYRVQQLAKGEGSEHMDLIRHQGQNEQGGQLINLAH